MNIESFNMSEMKDLTPSVKGVEAVVSNEELEELRISSADQYEGISRLDAVPDIENLVHAIDFKTLESIVSRYATRAGIKEDQINVIGSGRILCVGDITVGAAYDLEHNVILLSKVFNLEKPNELDKEMYDELMKFYKAQKVLRFICHEDTHALSFRKILRDDLNHLDKDGVTQGCKGIERSGFWTNYILEHGGEVIDEEAFFLLFTEGVTDKLAKEVYEEYRRMKFTEREHELLKTFEQYYGNLNKYLDHHREVAVEFVEKLIKKISDIVGIDQDTVWRAFAYGYLKGEDITHASIKEFLSEYISPGFFEKLAISNKATLRELTSILKEDR